MWKFDYKSYFSLKIVKIVIIVQRTSVIASEELHEQIESLSITFALTCQHVFADLAGSLQFRYSEEEFAEFGRHVRIV